MLHKLMVASGAIVRTIGQDCVIAGDLTQRRRCHEYIDWLLTIMHGGRLRIDSRDRDDVTEVKLHNQRRRLDNDTLRDIEAQTDTFILVGEDCAGDSCAFICSYEEGSRESEKGRVMSVKLISKLVDTQGRDDRFDWQPCTTDAHRPPRIAAPTPRRSSADRCKNSDQRHGWQSSQEMSLERKRYDVTSGSNSVPLGNHRSSWNQSQVAMGWHRDAQRSTDSRRCHRSRSIQRRRPLVRSESPLRYQRPSPVPRKRWKAGR